MQNIGTTKVSTLEFYLFCQAHTFNFAHIDGYAAMNYATKLNEYINPFKGALFCLRMTDVKLKENNSPRLRDFRFRSGMFILKQFLGLLLEKFV